MTSDASLLSTLESFLRLVVTREEAITSNMANVDTPGYQTRDINFQSELNRATSVPPMQLADGTGSAQFVPAVRQVPGLLQRPDGNDVSLDREGLLMAETQLQYQIGIALIKHEFHGMLSVINGGS